MWSLLLPIALFFIALMAQFSFTRKLLLKYPEFFTNGLMSHQGPTEANQKAMEFTMTLKAKGWTQGTPETVSPNKDAIVRISGKSPLYGLTSNSVLTCAKVILNEHKKMPGT